MLRWLFGVFLLLMTTPAISADPAGTWAFRAGDTTLFRFEIRRTTSGWSGIWLRPEHFLSDGESFYQITGPAVRRAASAGRQIDDAIELIFDDPRPNATPDVFRIRALDATHAEARYVGTGMEPFALVRDNGEVGFGNWDPARVYAADFYRPTNAEMTEIFNADQRDRQNWQAADHQAVASADRGRRARTQQLIDEGSLQSGDDFYHAAFVFQHGAAPEDYLKAHVLATIAVGRGKRAALWIAAASLDRYLQSIGQPQVLGTQFRSDGQGATTQDPYTRSLLSDALRGAMHVPTLAEQEQQRRRMEDRP